MAWLPISWAYVAGFFDGEGCVDCRVGRQTRGTIRRQSRLKIYQNRREVLDAIVTFLEIEGIKATVEIHHRPDRLKKGHSGSFALAVNGVANVYKMLYAMLPYLIVKNDEAIKAVEDIEERMAEIMEGTITDGRVTRSFEGVS
jgi:hypothetical protein